MARELPEKTEQTIFCELEPAQRKQYDELRHHYRDSLLLRVQSRGSRRSPRCTCWKRCCACGRRPAIPGCSTRSAPASRSAKLDVLLDQLDELREEGHKALVFSQFTSLLAIVRSRLDEAGVRYEYLDGATRDRQAHVEAFQNDPDVRAVPDQPEGRRPGAEPDRGGVCVPARSRGGTRRWRRRRSTATHRIGQTRPVFAYRLIARDTVEEKVLELQKTKRELADAILGEDNSLIRDLKREDLELLLS